MLKKSTAKQIRKMTTYSLSDIFTSTDRHKLYIFGCRQDEQSEKISFIQAQNIPTVNIGKELASFLDELEDYRYLAIEVYDFLIKLLNRKKGKINGLGSEIVAIYNLGIFLEPRLELNAVQLLKDFSKSTALVIIWENQIEQTNLLNWPTQKQNYFFNFSDIPLKKMQHAV